MQWGIGPDIHPLVRTERRMDSDHKEDDLEDYAPAQHATVVINLCGLSINSPHVLHNLTPCVLTLLYL